MKNKIINIFLFISIFLCLITNKVFAEISKENFLRIGIAEGLSSTNITCIYQDSIGYMWIGTDNGLNKYNGYDVKIYNYEINNDKSLSSTYITDIFEDDNGDMWIGTHNGLNILDRSTGEVQRIPVGIDMAEGISDSKITTIFRDSKANIWVGTENGLNKYNKEKKEFEKYLSTSEKLKRLADSYITSITEHQEGYLLVGTKQGINSIDLKDYNIIKVGKEQIVRKYIYDMEEDDSGNIWTTTNDGIYLYNMKSDKLEKFNVDIEESLNIYIDDIFFDSDNNLWFSGSNGAIKYSTEDDSYTVYKNNFLNDNSLSSNYVKCFYEDIKGDIWIGTINGLNILNNNQSFLTVTDFTEDYKGKNITQIFNDNNNDLWVGTLYNGIFKENKETKKLEQFYYKQDDILNTNSIHSIIDGEDNSLIVATKSGIVIINKSDGTYRRLTEENIQQVYNEEILSIYYEDDILWIGGYLGFYSYNMVTNEFYDYKDIFKSMNIAMEGVKYIYKDKNDSNILWLGGTNQGGLIKFNKETKKVKNYINEINNDKSIGYNSVNSIIGDEEGNLWIGTDYGLNKFNIQDETFMVYINKDGLGSNHIKAIVLDENNDKLWITTSSGISSLNIKNNQFTNYTAIDGILENDFNDNSVMIMPNNYIIFGGSIGLTYFSTNYLNDYEQKDISVVIDKVRANEITAYNTDEIELSHKYDTYRIYFFTLNYAEREKITYEYMLEGADEDWVYDDLDNTIKYNSLPPGEYVFKVRAMSNGEYSEIKTLNIIIKKPFWKTTLAYWIYLSIIVVTVFAVVNYVKILENLVRQRTIELKNQLDENKKLYNKLINEEKFKNNFFVNLSHELRTPLNIILSATQVMDILDDRHEKGMSKYINIIKRSSNSLLSIINDIIDSSKIETGHYHLKKKIVNIVYVVEEAALNMNEYIKANGLELIIDPEVEEKEVNCDATEIERIVVNLLSNAVKFTAKGGLIKVLINDKGENVEIIVEDTGTGISKEEQQFIFNRFQQGKNAEFTNISSSGIGLMLVKYLVELHNGEIKLESKVGKGSKFIILLPVR